jgi:hypothetical protein
MTLMRTALLQMTTSSRPCAGTHTPCVLASAVWRMPFLTTHARGYGSRRGGRDDLGGLLGFIFQTATCAQTWFRVLATAFARVMQIHPPQKERAQGRPGARCTRGLMCKGKQKNAHEHTGSAEAVRPSLRNGFTTYFVLSPARPELVCHRRPQEARASRELDTCHRGVRTTRLRRTLQPRSSVAALASTAPRPNVSDDGQRPLSRDGMAKNKQVIWVKSQE